jgi:hypothetical protein
VAFLEGERPRERRTPSHGVGPADGLHQSSITTTSTFGIRSGVQPSGKPTLYAPFPIWLWLNGHEWTKRQRQKAAIQYQALDNGFLSCAQPHALQKRCDQLGAGAVHDFFWRWFWRLPSPFCTKEVKAGYDYELAFRQFEVSETIVFDRPQAGRAWFEGVIRDHLDLGRPDQVALLFDRRVSSRTPGCFRTRLITRGVDPILSCYYKSSRIKQYFKEGRALRTETVICDTHDFGIGRRVCAKNWKALRGVGESANRRLCEAEAQDAMPAPDVVTFQRVTRPSTSEDGLYAPALRFGDSRVMALLGALVGFCHLVEGFTNGQRVAALLNAPYTTRQATYDLRRLKRKGLIRRLQKANRYELTTVGRAIAVLFTKGYSCLLAPGLAILDPRLPEDVRRRSPLATAWRALQRALEDGSDGPARARLALPLHRGSRPGVGRRRSDRHRAPQKVQAGGHAQPGPLRERSRRADLVPRCARQEAARTVRARSLKAGPRAAPRWRQTRPERRNTAHDQHDPRRRERNKDQVRHVVICHHAMRSGQRHVPTAQSGI